MCLGFRPFGGEGMFEFIEDGGVHVSAFSRQVEGAGSVVVSYHDAPPAASGSGLDRFSTRAVVNIGGRP